MSVVSFEMRCVLVCMLSCTRTAWFVGCVCVYGGFLSQLSLIIGKQPLPLTRLLLEGLEITRTYPFDSSALHPSQRNVYVSKNICFLSWVSMSLRHYFWLPPSSTLPLTTSFPLSFLIICSLTVGHECSFGETKKNTPVYANMHTSRCTVTICKHIQAHADGILSALLSIGRKYLD